MVDPKRMTLVVLASFLGAAGSAWAQEPASAVPELAISTEAEPDAISEVARWALATQDNRGLPFAVIDKSRAEISVFDADGRRLGRAPVLLGEAPGDDSTPGIGDRKLSRIRPEERTTPAGRFVAAFGPAGGGRKVLWIDYATAVSLHPAPTANPKERRLERLRSPATDDNRITYGCINVSRAFFEGVVRKTFAATKGVFYILPEQRPLDELFPTLRLAAPGEPDLLVP